MARIRSIHPDACTSERLATVSGDAERCYWRLQTHCDDEGRTEDNTRLIWAALFPLHEEVGPTDVDLWLCELDDAGLLVRYEVTSKRYLCITQWARFQHPRKPTPSKLPPHPPTSSEPVRDQYATGTSLVPIGEGEGVGGGEGGGVAPNTARDRDPLWDAIVECWCLETAELTDTERGRLNKAAKLLRDVEALPDEIPRRRARYRRRYPDAADTPLAVAGRWSELRQDDNGAGPKVAKAHGALERMARNA